MELLTHMVKTAKREQRSIVVTLLDLESAFISVHHNLIKHSLNYHHLPNEFVQIFCSIYKNAYISVAVGDQWTHPISVQRGLLQGDPSSPCYSIYVSTS